MQQVVRTDIHIYAMLNLEPSDAFPQVSSAAAFQKLQEDTRDPLYRATDRLGRGEGWTSEKPEAESDGKCGVRPETWRGWLVVSMRFVWSVFACDVVW
jgi:hypothetical protein